MFHFVVRRTDPHIALWWNADRRSRQGLCIHGYVANGYFCKSYRIGGLCLDVWRPTEYDDVLQLMKARERQL